jgi:HD superfamily phosphohydrolase
MNKIKIFNDPVYGLISFPHEILYDIIEHPYFQRLRRISQTGLTHLVYPGATHTRFHHVLGALHLMCKSINVLRGKGTMISDEESEAVCIAILLHDIGHGPFSHALEGQLLQVHHEELSLTIMSQLNEEFKGRLEMAIQIFSNTYPRKFLNQLVSSQLDMDRMDYLNRDSFYTGVAEGVIGYDRIISMLRVIDDQIVVEEKGIFSIEKFLIARKIMYWQVYLHKTVLSAEKMLIHFFKRYSLLHRNGEIQAKEHLESIDKVLKINRDNLGPDAIASFCQIDDYDIHMLLKKCQQSEDQVLKYLSRSIINRKLHKIHLADKAFNPTLENELVTQLMSTYSFGESVAKELIFTGVEKTTIYDDKNSTINILMRTNEIFPIDKISNFPTIDQKTIKYYLAHPFLKGYSKLFVKS